MRIALVPYALLLAATAPAQAGHGSVSCCPPEAPAGSERCLERLVRATDAANHAEAERAACASVAGTQFFRAGSDQAAGCGERNLLGMPVGRWHDNDWWQDGAPNFSYEHQRYHAERMALGSQTCQNDPAWASARDKCMDGFQAVHVYLSLSPDASQIFAQAAADADPWHGDPKLTDAVLMKSLSSYDEIEHFVRGLVMGCKIIRYLLVSSHGSPGFVMSGLQPKLDYRPVTNFIGRVITPCALAPRAKLQFDGCLLACGYATEPVRLGLERALADPAYAAPQNAEPLDGVQVLMGTGLMRDHTYLTNKYYFFGPAEKHVEISPENGQGLVFAVDHAHVTTDEPAERVPACPERYPAFSQRTAERIAQDRN